MFDKYSTIVRDEGWRGIYRGLGTNLIRTIPATAISLLTYEILVRTWR
jgi:solute carrier family 25 folate transporter 32